MGQPADSHDDQRMRWASALSLDDRLDRATAAVCEQVTDRLGGGPPDMALAFVSAHHRVVWDKLPRLLMDRLEVPVLVGCSGGGVLAAGREVEGRAGLAVVAARLPRVRVRPFLIGPDDVPERDRAAEFWRRRTGHTDGDGSATVVVLPDPFSTDAHQMVEGLDAAFPDGTIVGGLASGARTAGNNLVFVGDRIARDGSVGMVLSGDVEVESVVAQGCRPIGNPMFVTACRQHVIERLDDRRPVEVLHELFTELPARDQELLRYSLFLGLGMRPDESRYDHGDFLIRNLIGLDPESGTLAVATDVSRGQVVQFHLRDAEASASDLRQHLERSRARRTGTPAGALMFSCLGRGEHLYGTPDHDSRLFAQVFGDVPVGGFFCNGEIGPVEGTTFIHGYTSSFALFRPRGG